MTDRAIPLLLAVLLLVPAGCGGADPQKERERGGTLVAAIGDSITAGTPFWDPNPSLRARIPDPDPRGQWIYWAERALPGADFRNCGVPGERTDEIAGRLEDCAEDADVLIVQGGVNDLAQGHDPASAARNLRAIVRRGKRLGLRVAMVELLPWNGGYPHAAAAIDELNRRIARIGRDEDVPVLQWFDELEDPAHPDRMRLELTSDLAHPSIAGYRRLGESVELP